MDIPVGLVADLQRRKPARRPVGKVVAGAGLVVPPGAMLAAAFLSGKLAETLAPGPNLRFDIVRRRRADGATRRERVANIKNFGNIDIE